MRNRDVISMGNIKPIDDTTRTALTRTKFLTVPAPALCSSSIIYYHKY